VVKPKPSSTRTSATSSVAGSGGVVERERRSPRRPELIASEPVAESCLLRGPRVVAAMRACF
jgi:hypothetical protein